MKTLELTGVDHSIGFKLGMNFRLIYSLILQPLKYLTCTKSTYGSYEHVNPPLYKSQEGTVITCST